MKWKLALRIDTSPSDRCLNKTADWNPELSTRYRINRAIGRPRKRWEYDINDFLKQEFEDNKNPIESSNQTKKTWTSIAKDRGSWALLEEARSRSAIPHRIHQQIDAFEKNSSRSTFQVLRDGLMQQQKIRIQNIVMG